MMPSPRPLLLAALVAAGCEEATVIEPLSPGAFEAVAQPTMLDLSAAPAFADERGGGLFVDLAGRVLRVRPNGQRGALEAHPRNLVYPGPATGVYALGPTNALVATTRGVFVADQGWLIAPPWQALLPAEGLVGTAVGGDGVAWLAHAAGLFRLERGRLSELTLGGASLAGVTAVAIAPALDGAQGVWFAREGRLFSAAQTSPSEVVVRDSGLAAEALAGGVLGLAGIGAGRGTAGELWAITRRGLLLFTGTAWREYALPASPRRLVSSGRFAWLQAGDALYRYEADTRAWAEVRGLEAPGTLLGCDAAGSAWLRVGEATLSVGAAVIPRVLGVAQGARVFDGQLVLQASLPTASLPDALSWQLDDAEAHPLELSRGAPGSGATAGQTFFSLGGAELNGALKPISLAALEDGWHTLTVTARQGDDERQRRLHFEFRGAATAAVRWETDIAPISAERCARCHGVDTEPALTTYAQWRDNAAAIASAVRDARMPADGPMDTASISAIIRWVNGGALP